MTVPRGTAQIETDIFHKEAPMGYCINHPDRETSYLCMKHQIYLCEECLACRDPDIYCKFRSSCPIHFISKKGFKDADQADEAGLPEKAALTCSIHFKPEDITVTVPKGTTLLEAALDADVYVNASCNGKGSCGKCRLIVESGTVINGTHTSLLSDSERKQGMVLGCQARVDGDVVVRIPEETLEKKLRAVGMGSQATEKLLGLVMTPDPMVKKYTLEMSAPTLDDTVSDLERLKRALRQQDINTEKVSAGIRVMRQLTRAVREDNWHVQASILEKKCSSEIVDVRPVHLASRSLGLAVDLGTTSIVVYVVEMATGKVIAGASGHNSQAACGDDVINRIVCSEKDGVSKLKKMAVSTINNLSARALSSLEETHNNIENVVISGNTTMIHLLLGIDAAYIRREPYIPTVSEFPILKAGEIGLKAAYYAGVFIMPGPAGYVGGDIVSGVLYTGFYDKTPLTMFIDIGTNGEIVLGSNEFLMTAACSAGPAFEGGGIRWGMRAEDGAIEKVTLDPSTFSPDYVTVEDKPARGICGSGMIDLLSEMLDKGVIGQDGKFKLDGDHPRMTRFKEEPAFIIESSEKAGTSEDIIFTESDIRSLVLSKAAVFAGFISLLEQIGMDFSAVEQFIITGGFGQYLNIEKAVRIGLLPDIDRAKFRYMGNSSIAGAYMALMSGMFRRKAIEISNAMTYVDFSSSSRFMDEFVQAQFLPHTDMKLFPSLAK